MLLRITEAFGVDATFFASHDDTRLVAELREVALDRDVGISVEMMATFVRFWLASTPQLPDAIQVATRAKAGERYDNFLSALGQRLAKGPKIRQEIDEDVTSEVGAAQRGSN